MCSLINSWMSSTIYLGPWCIHICVMLSKHKLDVMNELICIFLHADLPAEPASFVKNIVFLPLDGFRSFVKYQVTICVWVHFWIFNSIPLIFLPVSVLISYSFYHFCSVIHLEVQDADSPRSSFIVENSFHYPGFWVIPNECVNFSF